MVLLESRSNIRLYGCEKLTESQGKTLDAQYHFGIKSLLKKAYGREFSMLESGSRKTKFHNVIDWSQGQFGS